VTLSKVLPFVAALWSAGACGGQPEIHLIPAGYQGPVTIVFNDPDGRPMEISGGEITYRIPSNGILRIRDGHPVDKPRKVRYFYVDQSGPLKEIPSSSDGAGIFVIGVRYGMRVADLNGKIVAVTYDTYFVGTKGSTNDWPKAEEESLDRAIRLMASPPNTPPRADDQR
jgi:hypothetical protein